MGLSQAELARKLGYPQSNVSRLERGQRSPTLRELMALAKAFNASVGDLLTDLERRLSAPKKDYSMLMESAPSYHCVPDFQQTPTSEEAVMAQLAAYGVRFLGKPSRPAVFKLALEETLLAALKHIQDPRVFEALPALVLRHVRELDWSRLVAGAFMHQLQNRLGMVVAAALQLRKAAPSVSKQDWEALDKVHARLAEARLDREEVVGPRPRSREALEHLSKRTPAWLRAWHALGSVDMKSLRRCLPR